MSGDAQRRKMYETRVIEDAIARLRKSISPAALPFAEEEVFTLATRARESFRRRDKESLARYGAHLSKTYDASIVSSTIRELEHINNAIGYEEK
jgi:hypothetical protein